MRSRRVSWGSVALIVAVTACGGGGDGSGFEDSSNAPAEASSPEEPGEASEAAGARLADLCSLVEVADLEELFPERSDWRLESSGQSKCDWQSGPLEPTILDETGHAHLGHTNGLSMHAVRTEEALQYVEDLAGLGDDAAYSSLGGNTLFVQTGDVVLTIGVTNVLSMEDRDARAAEVKHGLVTLAERILDRLAARG